MKCKSLFSGKNKKNISYCRLLKLLPSILNVNIRRTGLADVTYLSHEITQSKTFQF